MRREYPLLFLHRQPREQRQDLGVAVQRLVAQVLAQVVGGLADLALAGQEDEDVARAARAAARRAGWPPPG